MDSKEFDNLVLLALSYVPEDSTKKDFSTGLITADSSNFSGKYCKIILRHLENHSFDRNEGIDCSVHSIAPGTDLKKPATTPIITEHSKGDGAKRPLSADARSIGRRSVKQFGHKKRTCYPICSHDGSTRIHARKETRPGSFRYGHSYWV